MKKKTRWISLGAVLLLASVLVGINHHAQREPIARIPLPGGTELRLEYVTFGTQHRIPGAGRTKAWLSHITAGWPRMNLAPQRAEYTRRTATDCPVLWFSYFDPRTGEYRSNPPGGLKIESVMGPDLTVDLKSKNDSWFPRPNESFEVPIYDRRRPDFRVRITAKGQASELVVANPVAGQKFPEWKPEPLPRTVRVAGGDLTLQPLRLKKTGPAGAWFLQADFKLVADGEKIPGLFLGYTFSDATGNAAEGGGTLLPLGEPAWKVTFTAHRSGDFAFRADEGVTLGPIKNPGPAAFSEFTVPEAEKKRGLRYAALMGPGHYVWLDGKFVTAEVASGGTPERTSSFDQKHERVEFTLAEAGLMLLIEGQPSDFWVSNARRFVMRLKATDQARALRSEASSWSSKDLQRIIVDGRFSPNQNGRLPPVGDSISIQFVPPAPETVEFLVSPPQLPGAVIDTAIPFPDATPE